ncbi:MAG: N-acetylmuramoyl-L-alanine amidase [Bacteroidia bacterium]|nr:N-acetylmuramoyl-L-alanine amidase [Bacteroidia bacterium]MDW8157611.1 N-acetylmuramoyl-L-alanine amidase [Bacteroidia bacterium]
MYLCFLALPFWLYLQSPLLKSQKDFLIPPPDTLPSWIQSRYITFGTPNPTPTQPREISTIIIHSMYNPEVADSFSVDACLALLKRYNVSAHLIIDREGNIWQLLPLQAISYHAGKGQLPNGRTGINQFSVGIELINSYYTPITEKQYQALFRLTKLLCERYPIQQILRHSDIAPGRKTDPWNFDWQRFAEAFPKVVYNAKK